MHYADTVTQRSLNCGWATAAIVAFLTSGISRASSMHVFLTIPHTVYTGVKWVSFLIIITQTHSNTELIQTHKSRLLKWVNSNSQFTISELIREFQLIWVNTYPTRFVSGDASGEADAWGRVTDWTRHAFIGGSNDALFRWLLFDNYGCSASDTCGSEGQFSGNSTQKNHREHCKTPRWRSVVANHRDGGESLVVVTTLQPSKTAPTHVGISTTI